MAISFLWIDQAFLLSYLHYIVRIYFWSDAFVLCSTDVFPTIDITAETCSTIREKTNVFHFIIAELLMKYW